jgi:hypothetical protein
LPIDQLFQRAKGENFMQYLGIRFAVVRGRTRYIKLDEKDQERYRKQGANLEPLKDIGRRDPKEVICEMLRSIPRE